MQSAFLLTSLNSLLDYADHKYGADVMQSSDPRLDAESFQDALTAEYLPQTSLRS